MTKQFLIIILTISISINLSSCSSDKRSTPHDVPGNEGGIVGSGNSSDCNKAINSNKAECHNGVN